MSLIVTVLLSGGALAGCLSGAEEPALENETLNSGEEGGEDWESMPDNRSGDYSAFRETNATEEGSGGMAHDHDYWQGRSRVNLFEETAEMPPAPAPGGATVTFKPPPPALVYEGTASVEITISDAKRHACWHRHTLNGEYICSSNLDYHVSSAAPEDTYAPEPRDLPAMDVEFLHGASAPDEWISAGTIEWGEPFEISVDDPMWTDMPHATASLWAFKFTSSEPIDNTLVFDVSMDIVRSEEQEIPKWPGHPDFYPDKNWRLVHEGPATSTDGYGSTGTSDLVRPDRLISYGTHTLYVWANVSKLDSLNEERAPTHWYLRFHNASFTTWNITDPFDSDYTSDNRNPHWVLRVDPQGMDSPYQSSSRWELQLRGAFTTPLISCVGGCMPPYTVEYDLTVIATNEELPDDMYNPTRRAS